MAKTGHICTTSLLHVGKSSKIDNSVPQHSGEKYSRWEAHISIDPVWLHLELRLGTILADLRIHPNLHGPVNIESRRVLSHYLSPAAEVGTGTVDRKQSIHEYLHEKKCLRERRSPRSILLLHPRLERYDLEDPPPFGKLQLVVDRTKRVM